MFKRLPGDEARNLVTTDTAVAFRPAVIGKNGTSAIGTLVERTTRYVMLVHLPIDRSDERMRDALVETMATLPGGLISRSVPGSTRCAAGLQLLGQELQQAGQMALNVLPGQ